MAHNIGIYYNEKGIRDIMKGAEISKIEQEIMLQKLSQVRAEFITYFGFEGNFVIKRVDTQSRRSRVAFRIVANDARTTAALKKQPGWLAKFVM